MSAAIHPEPPALARTRMLVLIACLVVGALGPVAAARAVADGSADHLVLSEIVTGAASASDELIELYNPTAGALPLEGLEVIYVSSSGATVSRRAAWSTGAPVVPAGGHVLVANEAGIYAGIADALYTSGMAATGGSVALRVQGSITPIDAVGWGTAASSWREGTNAVAPAAGASLERLPGGVLGSTQDTDDNAADFVERLVPDPQNLTSPPTPDPAGATPSPTVSPTAVASVEPTPGATTAPTVSPSPSPTVTSAPTPTSGPVPITVVAARGAPDGAVVTIEATALTASDFHDGGGFLADATGGIAVLLDEGAYMRGDVLRVTGTVDDRFSQRTVRSTAGDLVHVGVGTEPSPQAVPTGAVDETVEGVLVRISGAVAGSRTALAAGTAVDVDDGSGAVRVVVPSAAGVDLSAWIPGAVVELVGVVGQRDSTGSGTEGYRVMPRATSDILAVTPASPTPSASTSAAPDATPSPSASDAPPGVVSISEARAAAKNARVRVRGVVTLAPGTVDAETAAIQDATGAIVLRLSDEAGDVPLGQRIEVIGMRSTKGGMETLRVSEPPSSLGTAAEPTPLALRTGDAGEAHEAILVLARGALVASARRASSGTVSFEIDDGSGPLRVSLDGSLEADDEALVAGTWVEVRGVLGQETTGAQPLRGYRIWPRSIADVRVVAAVTGADGAADDSAGDGGDGTARRPGSLGGIGGVDLAGLRVGATLVIGPWRELGVGGLLWDGSRLVAVNAGSSALVTAFVGQQPLPLSLELGGLRATGLEPVTGASLVALSEEPGSVTAGAEPPAAPRSTLPSPGEAPAWVSVVGRLDPAGDAIVVAGTSVPIDERCETARPPLKGMIGVTGVATADPVRLIVPCDGIAAAPLVGRTSRAPVAHEPAGAAPTALDSEPSVDPHRPLAAGLFLLGAVMLAAAALMKRARPDGDPAAGAADADLDAPDEGVAELPRLTLVRVRNEHGP